MGALTERNRRELAERGYTVVPRLVDMIEQLTNWFAHRTAPAPRAGASTRPAAAAPVTTDRSIVHLERLR